MQDVMEAANDLFEPFAEAVAELVTDARTK